MEPAFQMSTSPLIENAVALGSYGVDLERYYLNMSTIGSKLFKNSKFFFLKRFSTKDAEIDQFMDSLDTILIGLALP